MIILNFSHPLTDVHLQSIACLSKQEELPQVIDLPVKFDVNQPFISQLDALAQALPLSSKELQTLPILVNLPALNYIAALVIAYLHGVTGHFPSIIRLKPIPESTLTVFEVAEIINLQSLRDETREMHR